MYSDLPKSKAGCSWWDDGGERCPGLLPHQSYQSKPDPLAVWMVQSEAEPFPRAVNKAVSCLLACSPLCFGHLLRAKPRIYANRGALCTQDTAREAVRAQQKSWNCWSVCAKPLSKPPLLNIIFKCHILSKRDAFNGRSSPFFANIYHSLPLPSPSNLVPPFHL